MFRKRNKNQKKLDTVTDSDGIIILRKTPPGVCGGTDATLDTRAPKTITSSEMTFFSATSSLDPVTRPDDSENPGSIGYISAFAAPAGEGAFLFLETAGGFRGHGEKKETWAFLENKDGIFPSLTELVKESGIASKNGFHSRTHGLPEDFGGSVLIRYDGGEKISFSDNQCPVLNQDSAVRIKNLFEQAMTGKKRILPLTSDLREIRFFETRDGGEYTNAVLSLNPDGTGENKKRSKYEGTGVFESSKPVDRKTVNLIKHNIDRTGILAWAGLPDREYAPLGEKSITFVFSKGFSTTVTAGKEVPIQIEKAFFNIELEMTVKH